MGLFSGITGLLGIGGSKTNVTQTSSNQTDVTVDVAVQNILDLAPIAAVLEWLGVQQADQTQLLAASNLTLAATNAEIAAQQQAQQQALLNRAAPWAKAAVLLLGGGIFIWAIKKG